MLETNCWFKSIQVTQSSCLNCAICCLYIYKSLLGYKYEIRQLIMPVQNHVTFFYFCSSSASSNNGSINFQDRMQEVPCADSENLFPKVSHAILLEHMQ